jgi:sarcosine oxidase gamma subunit
MMGKGGETGPAAGARIEALRDFAQRVAGRGHESTAGVDAAAAEVLDAFDAKGLETLLLKGRGIAALLYEPGERRPYSDTDLLVSPAQAGAAEEALRDLGYVSGEAVRGVDDVAGVVPGEAWVRATETEYSEVDLHRWLPGAQADPTAAWSSLLARSTWIELSGRKAAVLDRGGQAMHLAMHAAQHGPAFTKPLDELALALERWPGDVWDSAATLAGEIGGLQAFAAGLRLLPRGRAEAERLGLPPTAELDWMIRHRWSRPRGTFHLGALANAQGLAGRLDVLRRALFPGRAWMTFEYRWARRGGIYLALAYALHVVRAPVWAARAWLFTQRARRAGQNS